MPATRLLILPSAGWPIDFNRNLNAFKLGLMVQKFVQIGAKVRAALHENLLNKKYWQVQRGLYDRSFAVVGLPRTYWLKLNYAF